MLKIIAAQSGHSLFITTKSDLVARDADLLKQIASKSRLNVSLTITTTDEKLAALTEPYAPRPYLRFQAIRKLSDAGIRTGVLAHPLMPLINDSEKSLESIGRMAAESGAKYISAAPLFLKPCSRAVFLPFVEQQFPHLARRYRERYEKHAYLKGEYPKMVQERIERVRQRYGLTQRAPEYAPEQYASSPQMALFE
jgi:DNA repair photolyase